MLWPERVALQTDNDFGWQRLAGTSHWRKRLPALCDDAVTLRALRASDAESLMAHINQGTIGRFIAVPPSSVEDFKRFIRWTQRQRRAGQHVCFGIVPKGSRHAIGLIQIWSVDAAFATAEWGFVLSRSLWGTGLFMTAARLALDFAFGTLGVRRLEARAADRNIRGNAVLCKLGAVPEGRLRGAFRVGALVRDHVLWSILAEEWRARLAMRKG